jgi:hypothetical protein
MKWLIQKAYPGTEVGRGVVIGQIAGALQTLDTDKAWVVEVKQHRSRRTLPQNSRFHAMCQELGQELGYTAGELKRLVKNELGFYAIIDGPCGKIKRLESSADWNTERMAQAIEQLNRWAAEVGHRWSAEP